MLAHPDDGSVESWTAEGSADKMRADFAGWDYRYVSSPFPLFFFCEKQRPMTDW